GVCDATCTPLDRLLDHELIAFEDLGMGIRYAVARWLTRRAAHRNCSLSASRRSMAGGAGEAREAGPALSRNPPANGRGHQVARWVIRSRFRPSEVAMTMFEKRTAFRRAVGGPLDGQTVEASADYDEFTMHPTDRALVPAMGGTRAGHYEVRDGILVWHERTVCRAVRARSVA